MKFVIAVLCGVLTLTGCGESAKQPYRVTMSKMFTPTTYACNDGFTPVVVSLGATVSMDGSTYELTQRVDASGNQISVQLKWAPAKGVRTLAFIVDNADHATSWLDGRQEIYVPGHTPESSWRQVTLTRKDYGGDNAAAITSVTACERTLPPS